MNPCEPAGMGLEPVPLLGFALARGATMVPLCRAPGHKLTTRLTGNGAVCEGLRPNNRLPAGGPQLEKPSLSLAAPCLW